jgi:diguanylate cyclase (GGDEF)-like protein
MTFNPASIETNQPTAEQLTTLHWQLVTAVLDGGLIALGHNNILAMSATAQELLDLPLNATRAAFFESFACEDRPAIQRALSRLPINKTTEIDVSMPNGYQRCELKIRCVSDASTASGAPTHIIEIQDVTSDLAAQLTVLYSASRHRAVLEGLREGVVIIDHKGRVTEANRAAAMIFARIDQLPMVGRMHADILRGATVEGRVLEDRELPTFRALFDSAATSDVILRLEGSRGPRWLSFSCQPIDVMTGANGAVLSVHDVTAQTLAENDLAYLAHHDPLTGLFNRARLRIEMQVALAQRRATDNMTVLVLDLDGFKDINDSHGHSAGDEVLVEIAHRLRNSCRQNDRVARLGGDEFAVLLGLDNGDASEFASRLITSISAPISIGDSSVSLGASIGIANSTGELDTEYLLMCADTAMVASKRYGKGISTVFRDDMLDRVLRRAELRSSLESAIENDEFTLVYQPKMRLHDRFVVGFEALLRWTTPAGEAMSPADFVPIAEETGQIVPIGRWVLQEAAEQLVQWQAQYERPDLTMAINVSARQLTDSTFADDLGRVLSATRVDPKTITLELTETMLIADPRVVAEALATLRAYGVLIAIDDYGSGNASISYLRNFTIDVLKVDRSLVLALDDDPLAGQAVVRSITDLAASLQLTTVVEGIERQDQLDVLQSLGCEEGQGFFLAMPLVVADVDRYLNGSIPATSSSQ